MLKLLAAAALAVAIAGPAFAQASADSTTRSPPQKGTLQMPDAQTNTSEDATSGSATQRQATKKPATTGMPSAQQP